MTFIKLRNVSFCILILYFCTQVYSQRIRYPNYFQNQVERCPEDRTCRAWSRCPPSRRSRRPEHQDCIYPNYSRRNPGVCCLNIARNPTVFNPTPVIRNLTPRSTRPNFDPRPTDPPTSAPLQQQNNQGSTRCGVPLTGSGLVIGGSPARQGVWPWLVAITRDSRGTQTSWCTAFLIDRLHVISAAHCFDNGGPSNYGARIGNVDFTVGDTYGIQNIAVPNGYTPGRFYDDIAVLTLSRPVDSPNFMPICLPSRDYQDLTGRGTTVAGWGYTSTGPRATMPNRLHQLQGIPVIANPQCNQAFRERLSPQNTQFPRGITEDFICAGFPEGGRDSCGGDSGGPLMHSSGGRWYAVGVVSFGLECALPNVPAGYTRVTSHLDFIRQNT